MAKLIVNYGVGWPHGPRYYEFLIPCSLLRGDQKCVPEALLICVGSNTTIHSGVFEEGKTGKKLRACC